MISPFHIATEGYLCSPLAVATDGYIALCDIVFTTDKVIVTKKQGGAVTSVPRYSPIRYVDPTERVKLIREQILREEEEIMIIIKTFLKCQ
jgi:hypothetical protein